MANTSDPWQTQQITNLTPILRVSDFSASMEYYTEKLGFTKAWEHGEPPTFDCVKRDSIELLLCLGSQGQPGTWISMFVLNVDALYEELSRRGANVVRHPVDEPWDMREMLVEDRYGASHAGDGLEAVQ